MPQITYTRDQRRQDDAEQAWSEYKYLRMHSTGMRSTCIESMRIAFIDGYFYGRNDQN